jgi:4-diphosphocytidyl-2-C-methyl-D-erythritol kinase
VDGAEAPERECAWIAPAKVNLSLEVHRRRADGYHDITSIMQAIDLADEVAITWRAAGQGIALEAAVEFPAEGGGLTVDHTNLAWRAAEAFARATGDAAALAGEPAVRDGARIAIRLRKRIPLGAGLGGGSSDAAAVLLGLNQLAGWPLGAQQLHALAAQLGADVPFFLVGGTCHAAGRGEVLRRLPPLPLLTLVLIAPRVPIDSRWAYEAWDLAPLTGRKVSASILESAIRQRSLPCIASALVNDLERVVVGRYGMVAEILAGLAARGVPGARMSGSGSSVFALIEDHGEALQLAASLGPLEHPVIVCRPSPTGCRPVTV